MVTYKSLQMFEREGTTYLGIPEDMIIDFLESVAATTKITNQKWKAVLVEKLGIVAAIKEELDATMADVIDSTIMQQIMESDKPNTERADWVKTPVPFIARSQYYRYTSDSLFDLNAKLKINYRLAWIYKLMSQRHVGIETKFEHVTGKTGGGKTIIMIPKGMVEAAKQLIADSGQIFATGLNPEDTLPEKTKQLPLTKLEVKPTSNGEPSDKITDEQKEISEMVLMLLDRKKTMSMASLKRECENHMDRGAISLDAFSKIIRNLEISGFITIDGSTVALK